MLAFLADVDPDFRFGSFPVAENVIHECFLSLVKRYYRCLAPGVKDQSRRRVLRTGVDSGTIANFLRFLLLA